MRRIAGLITLALAATGILYLQTAPSKPQLAGWMPGGALLYLEAADFGKLLREWNDSQAKTDWLESANYADFSVSNLFSKLGGVYAEYSAAGGYAPGLGGLLEIAGSESALALYDIRDVQFLYITKLEPSRLTQAALWSKRNQFQLREASGLEFYLKSDPASGRTVAFSFANGYFLLATREDLVGRALTLMAGQRQPNVAGEPWYQEAVSARRSPGDLRLVLNLAPLTQSVYFRSYWVHRNVSAVRQFWSGLVDLRRSEGSFVESRLFLRSPEAAASASAKDPAAVARLLPLAPESAGYYRVLTAPRPAEVADLVVSKLIAPASTPQMRQTAAPGAANLDATAGSESELDTRIDQEPLSEGIGPSDLVPAVSKAFEDQPAVGLLQVQKSVAVDGTFVRTPCLLVLTTRGKWIDRQIRDAVGNALGTLRSSQGIGVGWVQEGSGSAIWKTDGLGPLYLTADGDRLYLSNDRELMAEVLARSGAEPNAAGSVTYAAAFRMSEELPQYQRIMSALDQPGQSEGTTERRAFFSDNLGSLFTLLAGYKGISIEEQDSAARVSQTVRYGPPQAAH